MLPGQPGQVTRCRRPGNARSATRPGYLIGPPPRRPSDTSGVAAALPPVRADARVRCVAPVGFWPCWTPSTPPPSAGGAPAGWPRCAATRARSTSSTSTRCPTATPAPTWCSPSPRPSRPSPTDLDAGRRQRADRARARVLRLMARGALLGARGNSGVILSQILRGLADALAAAPAVRGRALAAALRSRPPRPRTRRSPQPVEGTVLTVVAAAAGRGRAARTATTWPRWSGPPPRAAAEALARTPEQLPALARAGRGRRRRPGLCRAARRPGRGR